MTPPAFKTSWKASEEALSPISKSTFCSFNLSKFSTDFLNTAGLTGNCGPDLSFVNYTDDLPYSINRLTEQYDFIEDKLKFDKYIVIGCCRNGDAIAIDTGDNDKIIELDPEDLFRSMYLNSSIETMADYLILYRDFEKEVLEGKDLDDNFQCFNFTDEQFEQLKSKMYAVDTKAMDDRGFWKEDLEIMLSIRRKKFACC